MKNLITKISLVLAVVFISGCSVLGAKYDNNEYASIARVEVLAREGKPMCERPDEVRVQLKRLKAETEFLYTYTRYLPGNAETHKIAYYLRDNVSKMSTRYANETPSVGYCKGKFIILIKQTQRSLESVGSKVR